MAVAPRVSLLALVPFLAGCYLINQAAGQVDILLYREPVDALIESRRLSDESTRKLGLIGEARAFGEQRLGLTRSDNYTTYYDTGGRPVSWIVTGCRKDRFESHTWWFPIVGTLPYKGYFSLDDARDEARSLQRRGYDVTLGPVAAYSTLGWFSDPVFSSMLRHDDADLVVLIIHELTHGTVFATGHGDWNEGLASFVGAQGAVEFFSGRSGAGKGEAVKVSERVADEETIDAFTQRVVARLQRLYRSGVPGSEKLTRREQVWAEACEDFAGLRASLHSDPPASSFRGRINNAELIARLRYGRYDVFRKAFDAAGRDWKAFFAKMREAADASDPFKAME